MIASILRINGLSGRETKLLAENESVKTELGRLRLQAEEFGRRDAALSRENEAIKSELGRLHLQATEFAFSDTALREENESLRFEIHNMRQKAPADRSEPGVLREPLNGTRDFASPLRVICVGTGRDGSTSVSQMIQAMFDREGQGRRVMHEWEAMEFYGNFCNFKETGESKYLELIARRLKQCPYDCIVGNGYAPILDMAHETFGDKVTLVHLRRRNREACVASLARNAELFPMNFMYYTNSEAIGKRIAAFHYDEAESQEWSSWSTTRKFAWYYDKTHSLIDSGKRSFERTFYIETESLGDRATRKLLGLAIGTDLEAPEIHVNRHLDLDSIAVERRVWVQRLLGKLDVARLGSDEMYGITHFLQEFLAMCATNVDSSLHFESADEIERVRVLLQSGYDLLMERAAELDKLGARVARNRERLQSRM